MADGGRTDRRQTDGERTGGRATDGGRRADGRTDGPGNVCKMCAKYYHRRWHERDKFDAFSRCTLGMSEMCAKCVQNVCKMCANCVQNVCKMCAKCNGLKNMRLAAGCPKKVKKTSRDSFTFAKSEHPSRSFAPVVVTQGLPRATKLVQKA